MSRLLLISLGPIQDFIASARRCQDLWFGSWLLSDLARTVARTVEEDCGGDALVFPASTGAGLGSKPAVANKILVRLGDGQDVRVVAERGRSAMHDRLEQVEKRAFQRLEGDPTFLDKQARAQIHELMEYVWVSTPATGDYAAARREGERLLAARKNTRSWKASTWGDEVPKSSLDGLRESVVHEDVYDPQKKDRYLPPEKRRRMFGIKGDERLCGVGLLKRLGLELDDHAFGGAHRPAFHSTTHVASAPLRARLAREAVVEQELEGYFSSLERAGVDVGRFAIRRAAQHSPEATTSFDWLDGRGARAQATPLGLPWEGDKLLDGYLLYPSRIDDILEQRDPDQTIVAAATKKAVGDALGGALRAVGVSEPPAYYAVLLADGDAMGRALDEVAAHGVEAHRRIGAALDRFSLRCRALVEQHAGSLIYAGGDDVLALVPLHTMLPCARALHEAFGQAIAGAIEPGWKLTSTPTLSVGLAVAHHLSPMAEALALARKAERRAKSVDGKDALAILVDKRSGPEIAMVDRWSHQPDERLERWVRLYANEVIPGKAAHDLSDAMAPLFVQSAQGGEAPALNDVAASLAKRVLLRKQFGRGNPGAIAEVERTRDELAKRFQSAGEVARAIEDLSQELQIARALLPTYLLAYDAPATTDQATVEAP